MIIALSISIVWIGRLDNIAKEFKEYRIPDVVRTVVGATKISLAHLVARGYFGIHP